MIDFSKLDPETRCVALVGEFLRRWSEMEGAIHRALASAMDLDETMQAILCANISIRDKLSTLRTIVFTSTLPPDDKLKADKLLAKVAKYASIRNIIAHTAFQPDPNGAGVSFLRVIAKGELKQWNDIWPVKRFAGEYKKIDLLKSGLTTLATALAKSQFPLGNLIIEGFPLGMTVPMRRTMSPALANFLSQQTPLPLRSQTTNEKKEP
jgi:hypothetical protein